MKIGVVSDTHSYPLPEQMLAEFKGVQMILHAGDICAIDDLNVLKAIAPVEAVHGNMDDRVTAQEFPEKKILKIEGKKIAMIHGRGPAKKVPEFVREEFTGAGVDAVIFGHSHCAFNELIDGVLYFNPGSPTDRICANCRSYGILEVTPEYIKGRIVKIEG